MRCPAAGLFVVALSTACTPPPPTPEATIPQPAAHPECAEYLDRVRDHRDAIASLAGSLAATGSDAERPSLLTGEREAFLAAANAYLDAIDAPCARECPIENVRRAREVAMGHHEAASDTTRTPARRDESRERFGTALGEQLRSIDRALACLGARFARDYPEPPHAHLNS